MSSPSSWPVHRNVEEEWTARLGAVQSALHKADWARRPLPRAADAFNRRYEDMNLLADAGAPDDEIERVARELAGGEQLKRRRSTRLRSAKNAPEQQEEQQEQEEEQQEEQEEEQEQDEEQQEEQEREQQEEQEEQGEQQQEQREEKEEAKKQKPARCAAKRFGLSLHPGGKPFGDDVFEFERGVCVSEQDVQAWLDDPDRIQRELDTKDGGRLPYSTAALLRHAVGPLAIRLPVTDRDVAGLNAWARRRGIDLGGRTFQRSAFGSLDRSQLLYYRLFARPVDSVLRSGADAIETRMTELQDYVAEWANKDIEAIEKEMPGSTEGYLSWLKRKGKKLAKRGSGLMFQYLMEIGKAAVRGLSALLRAMVGSPLMTRVVLRVGGAALSHLCNKLAASGLALYEGEVRTDESGVNERFRAIKGALPAMLDGVLADGQLVEVMLAPVFSVMGMAASFIGAGAGAVTGGVGLAVVQSVIAGAQRLLAVVAQQEVRAYVSDAMHAGTAYGNVSEATDAIFNVLLPCVNKLLRGSAVTVRCGDIYSKGRCDAATRLRDSGAAEPSCYAIGA